MTTRQRKFVGSLLLTIGLIIYIFAASVLATAILPDNIWIQTLFYAVAGIVWVIPVRSLILWMNRPDP